MMDADQASEQVAALIRARGVRIDDVPTPIVGYLGRLVAEGVPVAAAVEDAVGWYRREYPRNASELRHTLDQLEDRKGRERRQFRERLDGEQWQHPVAREVRRWLQATGAVPQPDVFPEHVALQMVQSCPWTRAIAFLAVEALEDGVKLGDVGRWCFKTGLPRWRCWSATWRAGGTDLARRIDAAAVETLKRTAYLEGDGVRPQFPSPWNDQE